MTMTTRRLLASIVAGAVLAGTALAYAADAGAQPTFAIDPHVPQPGIGYCPGGGSGGFGGLGFCDGRPYPDNTKWHQVRGFVPFAGYHWQLQCVINTGELLQPIAPPGGCGGAW